MIQYIDRKAAMTLPVMPKRYRKYLYTNLDDAYEAGWHDALKCVGRIQPEDVRPTEHGEWLRTKQESIYQLQNFYYVYKCSLCGHEAHNDLTNFCPNCGARLKGVTNG